MYLYNVNVQYSVQVSTAKHLFICGVRPKKAEQWLVIRVAEAEVQSRCRRAEPRQT